MPAVPHEHDFALSRADKIFTMAGILLGLLLAALDQTIVATAGPAIQVDLAIAPSLYPWLTTAYMVASTMMVPIYGKLSDLYGRKPILLAGIGVFLLGSLLCGLSQSTVQLILFRAVQGAGSASIFTSAFAVTADLFAPSERGKYQGFFSAVFGVSSVIGPLIGGFITDTVGWHWVFFVNLPLGALAVTFIVLKMPRLHRETGRRPRIDFPGAAALMVAVVPLLLALSLGRREVAPEETGFLWGSWQILALFAVSAVGLVAFLAIERTSPEPILSLSLFRNRTFAVANAATFVIGATFFATIVFLPLFMVNVVGLSATRSGLTLTPLMLGIVSGNILSGQLVSRLGHYRALTWISLSISALGFAVMAFTLSVDSSQREVTLKMVLLGIGLGPFVPLFTLIVQNAVEPRQIGVATATVTFFRALGGTVGIAVFGTIFGAVLAAGLADRLPEAARDLPPAIRQQLGRGSAAPAASEESAGQLFPVEAVRKRVAAELARRGARPPESERALTAVDEVHAAFRASFADAIHRVYLWAFALAIVGLGLALLLPERPLRRAAPTRAAAEGAQATGGR